MACSELLIELSGRYAEPHRHYHDLRHIADMLMNGRAFPLNEVQVMAVWFHDAVYDATRSDNEERSAVLAEERLGALGWPGDAVARVARIVRDTAGHVPSDAESAVVLDLDLASLAAEPAVFRANRAAIRLEYAHVGDADFSAGTARFAAGMLDRDRLFHTDWGAPLEERARANLRGLLVD